MILTYGYNLQVVDVETATCTSETANLVVECWPRCPSPHEPSCLLESRVLIAAPSTRAIGVLSQLLFLPSITAFVPELVEDRLPRRGTKSSICTEEDPPCRHNRAALSDAARSDQLRIAMK